MPTAALLGAVAASTLLLGALLAYLVRPSPRIAAVTMALGSGLLIGSVAFDLVEDARLSLSIIGVAMSLVSGAAVFVLGARLIDRRGGGRRKSPTPTPDPASGPLPIVFGSILDGVPESFVLGLSVLQGAVSVPLLVGIGLSNLPEGLAASAGLRYRGWTFRRVLGMWSVVVVTSAVSAALGHVVLSTDAGGLAGVAQTFAAGALLAMIADTMIPEAYATEREWTGGLVVAGFAGSLILAAVLS